jgi:hypothetical protein
MISTGGWGWRPVGRPDTLESADGTKLWEMKTP